MVKMIVDLEPFVMTQNIYILDEDVIIGEAKIHVDEIAKFIDINKEHYNIEKVILYGNENYLNNFRSKLITEFSLNDMDIDIVNH